MSDVPAKAPLLDALYQRYLTDETSAHFVAAVSDHYTLGTLARLAAVGSRVTRRAAVLAIGFLGDFRANGMLGRALHDRDRVVRLLAENSIREIWCRDGTEPQQQYLQVIIRLNNSQRFDQAAREACQLICEADGFAEAWNQRAIAYYQMERFDESVLDCRTALGAIPIISPPPSAWAIVTSRCRTPWAALESFRWALRVNPDMENVRAQVGYLQRTLEGS